MVGFEGRAGWVVGCYITEGTGGHPGWDGRRGRPGRGRCVAEALSACADIVGEDLLEWTRWSSLFKRVPRSDKGEDQHRDPRNLT